MIDSSGLHKRRAEFADLNAHLQEDPSQYYCSELWQLLTSRHRHGFPSCDPGSGGLAWESECFLRTAEFWIDTVTGLPVMVLQLDCKHHDVVRTHEHSLNTLTERGLWYATADASWVLKGARIVVIARADIIDRIRLPNHLDSHILITDSFCDLSRFPTTRRPEIDWKKREALRLAEEQAVRNSKASLASEAESRGYYQTALDHHCETAYADRSGGFHKIAQEQLARARALIEAHPDLDVDKLRFKNAVDLEYVFYNAKVMVSCEHLERRLSNVPLPPDWERFCSHESTIGEAGISGPGRSGLAMIDQDEKGYRWKATVFLNNGPFIAALSAEDSYVFEEDGDYCYETPEAAAEATIKIYYNYGRLLMEDGVPITEVIEITGAVGKIQSGD